MDNDANCWDVKCLTMPVSRDVAVERHPAEAEIDLAQAEYLEAVTSPSASRMTVALQWLAEQSM